mmetsp:Transcript_22543/g.47484  ORF Transcript_22543/g.47484 Transcript_22543/m.47484 type:complete len:288 (+) Transcript_22543:427-1290(+)
MAICFFWEATLREREGLVDDVFLLLGVDEAESGGRHGAGVASDVGQVALHLHTQRAHAPLDARHHIRIRPHVLRLLLQPVDGFCVGVAPEFPQHEVVGERRKLFEPHHVNGVFQVLALLPLGVDLVVNLTRAEEELLHLVLRLGIRRAVRDTCVHDESLESDLREAVILRIVVEIVQGVLAGRVLEQVFWGHDDQGLPELPVHLAPQEVEVVGRGRAVDHLPVALLQVGAQVTPFEEVRRVRIQRTLRQLKWIFGAHLEESLEPGAAVLSPAAVVAVRQEHHKPRLA